MNRLLAALAVLTAVATPALAQPFNSHSKSFHEGSAGSYAQVSPRVYDEEGTLVGRDPDPNVRLEMYKDANSM
jgi:hypothetical protein